MVNFWKNKRVLVTGGAGFVGSRVVEQLLPLSRRVTITTKSNHLNNIETIKKDIQIITANLTVYNHALRATKNQDIIINLASKVAGIQFNISHPATMFSDNMLIANNLIASSVKNNIERFLVVSSACVYPRFCKIPTPETEGFIDDPEPTNLGYGWAKRTAELLGRFYSQEYGLKVGIVRAYNAYGPRDIFDPNISHVIPGLIKKVFDGENPLVVWGSGKQTRSFLYVDDFARGIIKTIEKYPNCDPINLGGNEEIAIGKLAKMIVELSGKNTKIIFDKKKPDGQPRRSCNTSKAKRLLNFKTKVDLKTGLKNTIKWYKQHLLF